MKRKLLGLMLVMAMGMSLLAGCGGSEPADADGGADVSVSQSADDTSASQDSDNANASQDADEKQENKDVATAVITDVFTGKKIEVTYNKTYCEKQDNGEYLLSVCIENGEMYDIEFFADYTANDYYQEQVAAFASMGLEASELENYVSEEKTVYGFSFIDKASGSMYSHILLHEVEGGVLIVHNSNLDISNEENAKTFVDKIFVSAEVVADDASNSDETVDSGKKNSKNK